MPDTEYVRSFLLGHPPSNSIITADGLVSAMRAAEQGQVRDLFSLFRDCQYHGHVQAEFSKRMLAVLGDPMVIAPADEDNLEDTALADWLSATVSNCTGWLDGIKHLARASVWPVSVVEMVWGVDSLGRHVVQRLIPVPPHLLEYTTGKMRIERTDALGNTLGQFVEVPHNGDWRFIVHRGHLMTEPDTFGGPMRSVLFWWLFATLSREWWAQFLERYGMPLLIGTVAEGDTKGRRMLQQAFSSAMQLFGLVIQEGTSIKTEAVNSQGGGDAFQAFHAAANAEISKIFVGGDLSASGQNLGLGGGQGALQGQVRADIRQWDALVLGATLQKVFAKMALINRLPGKVPQPIWGAESAEDLKGLSDVLVAARAAGLEPDDKGVSLLSRRAGLTFRRTAAPAPPMPRGFAAAAAHAGGYPTAYAADLQLLSALWRAETAAQADALALDWLSGMPSSPTLTAGEATFGRALASGL